MELFQSIWASSKRWRVVPFGPVSVFFRLGRTRRVSSNFRRRFREAAREWLSRLSRNKLEGSPLRVAAEAFHRLQPTPTEPGIALIVGVGPGLGFSFARQLVRAGMDVALGSRNAEEMDPLVTELRSTSTRTIRAYGCDATSEISVRRLMSHVVSDMGVPDLVVYSAQDFGPGRAIDVEVPRFEECWRTNCLGAFILAREAARRMIERKRGTIVLVGSTSGLIGRAEHLNLAVGKFGLRALSQVMARELWAAGIHVLHLVIDADIKEGSADAQNHPQADPDDIASLLYTLHKQPQSAWSSEIDVRPWNERFWEHC